MSLRPTIQEVIAHLSEHYGITKTQVVELMRIPIHPRTLRDDLAIGAMSNIYLHGDQNPEYIANRLYQIADAALKERLK